MFSLPVDYEPQCAAVNPGQTEVAVGGISVHVLHYFHFRETVFILKPNLLIFFIKQPLILHARALNILLTEDSEDLIKYVVGLIVLARLYIPLKRNHQGHY